MHVSTTPASSVLLKETFTQLIKDAREGSIEARNTIIEKYIYIIDIIEFKLKHIKFIDVSTKRYGAFLGLLRAIENYDDSKGEFSNYAYVCAMRKAQREMNSDWLIRIPDAKIGVFLKERKLPYEIMSLSGGFDSCQWYSHVDSEGNEIAERTMEELITHDKIKDTEIKKVLEESLNELEPIEKDAIYYKYGFDSATLKQIGLRHGFSHEWVRLKCKSAFKKLNGIVKKKLKQKKDTKWLNTK